MELSLGIPSCQGPNNETLWTVNCTMLMTSVPNKRHSESNPGKTLQSGNFLYSKTLIILSTYLWMAFHCPQKAFFSSVSFEPHDNPYDNYRRCSSLSSSVSPPSLCSFYSTNVLLSIYCGPGFVVGSKDTMMILISILSRKKLRHRV